LYEIGFILFLLTYAYTIYFLPICVKYSVVKHFVISAPLSALRIIVSVAVFVTTSGNFVLLIVTKILRCPKLLRNNQRIFIEERNGSKGPNLVVEDNIWRKFNCFNEGGG
jgi:hypothetical protein